MEYLIAALMVLVGFLTLRLARTSNEKHRLEDLIEGAEMRAAYSDQQAEKLVLAVSPLIVKTDWMTGRWHGQFDFLRHMEAKRNEEVEVARAVISTFPVVRDSVDPNEVFAGAADTFVKEIHREVGLS